MPSSFVGGFRDLVVYRRSAALADEIYEATARWPGFERWTVGVQAVRAADSVGANIAESRGRWSHSDRRRLLIVARGSAFELEHWLDRATERGLEVPRAAVDRAAELSRMLNGLVGQERPDPSPDG